MIDKNKYEKAYEEWILMEEPMGSFQEFLFVEYQKAHTEVKRLREGIEQAIEAMSCHTNHRIYNSSWSILMELIE